MKMLIVALALMPMTAVVADGYYYDQSSGVSGYSTDLGNGFQYYRFNNGYSGSSQNIGGTTFYNVQPPVPQTPYVQQPSYDNGYYSMPRPYR